MGGRTAQEASPLRAFSGRIADSRGQVQPLTAENLEIWTNALNEYREEMHTAFLMRYVRDQSRLAQTMPRVLGKAQPTSAPSEPKSKDMVAIEEVLSSTEKPAKRNLVLGMRKKDGSTPDAPTPHVRKRAGRTESPLAVLSHGKGDKIVKSKKALKETPCIEVSDEDSEDGRLEVKKGRAPDHDRPNERRKRHKKHDNNESGSEKEEEDERPLKKARKESKKSNGASKKPGKKDRANDEAFQSRLVVNGSRLTIKKPGEDADNRTTLQSSSKDQVVSIANKLGIFNKGKASAKAAFAMPSLSFNETKFLKDGTGKTSRVADPLKTAVAKDNKNLRDGTKKEDAGKISEFFALDDDRQASKERTKPRDADPPNVLLDDVLPPPDVPKISAGKILIPEAKSSAESEASPKAAPVAQSLPRPLETEDAVVVDASHFLRKKASKPREHYRIDENDKENSVPPSNPIEKAPTAKPVAEIHGAEPVEKRSSTGIRKHQAIIDMEAASRLVEGLENTYEAGDYAEPNEETIEDYPYAADWEEPICEETCNDGVEEEYYGDDGVDQLGWEARYLDAFHDEANGNIGFDVMLGPGDDHLTEQFGFEDHDVSAPWDEQVQFSQYSSSAINQQGNLRLSGASSGLPWRSTKPAASRQSLALKHSTPLSIQHASWRSVAESLSNRAASDEGLSRRGSIGPFGRPNHLF